MKIRFKAKIVEDCILEAEIPDGNYVIRDINSLVAAVCNNKKSWNIVKSAVSDVAPVTSGSICSVDGQKVQDIAFPIEVGRRNCVIVLFKRSGYSSHLQRAWVPERAVKKIRMVKDLLGYIDKDNDPIIEDSYEKFFPKEHCRTEINDLLYIKGKMCRTEIKEKDFPLQAETRPDSRIPKVPWHNYADNAGHTVKAADSAASYGIPIDYEVTQEAKRVYSIAIPAAQLNRIRGFADVAAYITKHIEDAVEIQGPAIELGQDYYDVETDDIVSFGHHDIRNIRFTDKRHERREKKK